MAEDTTSMGAYELEWAMCEEAAELADERTNEQAERIAALEAENARLRAEYARLESAFVQLADKDIAVALINLDKARLLLVAIDENIWLGSENINCMGRNPLTIAAGRIVELLRDPASNPWAALMRAGKEGGE